MEEEETVVTVDNIAPGGDGCGRINGYAMFIPYGCPHDTLRVRIVEKKKTHAYAEIVKIINPSSYRVIPPCPYYFNPEKAEHYKQSYRFCGGCHLQHVSYDYQCYAKQEIIKETFKRIAHITDIPIEPIQRMADPWHYRNKIQLPVGEYKKKILIGFFKPGSHEIVNIDDCLVEYAAAKPVIADIRQLISQLHLKPYHEKTHQGWLRHILIRTSFYSNKICVVFITRTDEFPREKEVCSRLLQNIHCISGIFQNINPHKTNVILGYKTRMIWGTELLEEKIGHVKYIMKPTAFFQINPLQTEILYSIVAKRASLTGKETVFDIYCGSGGIGIYLARHAQSVIGIDESSESIASAHINAAKNNFDNCRFFRGRAYDLTKKLISQCRTKKVIVLDPPRAGCEEIVLTTVASTKAPIIYVSCNPATLARDVSILLSYKYRIESIVPVDMFPHTSHIESVTLLTYHV